VNTGGLWAGLAAAIARVRSMFLFLFLFWRSKADDRRTLSRLNDYALRDIGLEDRDVNPDDDRRPWR